MKKRTASIALALAMLLSFLPAQRAQAEEEKQGHRQTHSCSEQCSCDSITWLPWSGEDRLPADSGHYYLISDVLLEKSVCFPQEQDITICLNGHIIQMNATARIDGKLTISDCTASTNEEGEATSGAVIGGADGGIFRVSAGGVLVLESGKLTGGKTGGNGGAVYLEEGIGEASGGRMYMYGGEISGNTAMGNGGGIYAADRALVEIYGGAVWGNTAENAPGIYIDGRWSQVSAGGKVQLESVVFSHEANGGLGVDRLAAGSRIHISAAASEVHQLVHILPDGRQDSWSCHWIMANGESVSFKDGEFVLGHYHGDTKYEVWTGGNAHNTLPSGSKHYYLANDILRSRNGGTVAIGAAAVQHLCLNGFTITHRNPRNRLYNVQGEFYLEDCSAYTDDRGNYISGGITYAGETPSTRSYGSCFNIQRGGSVKMSDGQIYGFHSEAKAYEDGAVVYVQGASATAKAVFCMEGGQIHSSSANCSGAAIRMTQAGKDPAREKASQVCICGGKLWGNTSRTGAIVAATGDTLCFTGGVITGNRCVAGVVQTPGRVIVSGAPVITQNQGGNLYLAAEQRIDLGPMTGGKVGICVTQGGRPISTAQQTDYSGFFESDDENLRLTYRDGCLYLGAAHSHGIDGAPGQTEWILWEADDSLPESSGNYCLQRDVQLCKEVTLPENTQLNLCLNGRTITAARGERIMQITNGSTLTLTDCCQSCGTITGGRAIRGGAFCVLPGGALVLYHGVLADNAAEEDGGAIYIQPAGCLELYGGQLKGNEAKRGAGVYAEQSSRLLLAGGRIEGNRVTEKGGGLYLEEQMGLIRVQGAPQVEGNTAGTARSNLYLAGEQMLCAEPLTDARIFVSSALADRPITAEAVDEQTAACFYSDSQYRVISHREQVYLEISAEHTHCLCRGDGSACSHEAVIWQAWESSTSLPTVTGSYYLLEDVLLEETAVLEPNQAVRLCLNGKTVTAPKNSRAFQIPAGASLDLSDCSEAGKITGGSCDFGGAVNVHRTGVFRLYGGTLAGNQAGPTANGLGGAVYLQAGKGEEAGGSFYLLGGTIRENSAYAGGAIYAAESQDAAAIPAQIRIAGGLITQNQAGWELTDQQGERTVSGGKGAAIYAGRHSVLVLEEGTLSENRALTQGGGIYICGGSAKLTGGRLLGNEGGKAGGGIFATDGAKLELAGAVLICDNRVSDGSGGGIAVSDKAQVTLSDGTVSGNQAIHGGGVFLREYAQLTVTGGYIGHNSATDFGGGICARSSQVGIYGGAVENNLAGEAGGGMYCEASTTAQNGARFRGNAAQTNGGAVCIREGTAEIAGGVFEGNAATTYGGAFYFQNAMVTVEEAQVTDNDAQTGSGAVHIHNGAVCLKTVLCSKNATGADCGGVCATKGARLTIKDSILEGNEAGRKGGGLLLKNGAQAVLQAVTIRENLASEGGGMYVDSASLAIADGGQITGNKSVCRTTDQAVTIGGLGAGVFMNSNAGLLLYGTDLAQNRAQTLGGGAYLDKQAILIAQSVTVQGNEAGTYGGGIYALAGADLQLRDALLTDNRAAETGCALWAAGALTLRGVQVSGNTTKNGSAVYLAPHRTGTVRLCGAVRICDNKGTLPDLYVDQGVTIQTEPEGLKEHTRIRLQLHSRPLTQVLLGDYCYDGSDGIYTVTYGTMPEESTQPEPTQTEAAASPQPTQVRGLWWLWVLPGLAAVLLCAAAFVVIKKKKADKASGKS